jgi:long-chain acyl-CoA synthetase
MEVTRIFDLLNRFEENPETIGKYHLAEKINGNWIKYSVADYIEISNNISYGLLALGIKKGDKIATITNNRPQWNFVDMGLSQIGAVHVTVYNTVGLEEFEYILRHSDTKIIFISDKTLYKKIKPISDKITGIEIYTFDSVEGAKHWSEIAELGKKSKIYYEKVISEIKESITEDDVFTIIYTSGTTGMPKGVMLSHKNMVSNMIPSAKRFHLSYNDKVLSFLPLAHVFEHMTSYIYQYNGVSVYYAENVGTIAQNINELKVNGFITVPRLLEAIYEKISDKASSFKGLKKKIFDWALKVGEKYEPYGKSSINYKLQHKLADKLVFTKWRAALSDKISFVGCGGSALQPRLARLFWAAGFPVFEGYGLTETSPILAVNYYEKGKVKLGTVGTILDNVVIKIAEDGEILAKGPNIMKGYYKDEEHTAMMFNSDGWFLTGDIGMIDSDGLLKITDRKKEIFKMSNGKYIAPQVIENKLKESLLISQTMVVGENQKFASVLISPNFDFLKKWCEKNKINCENRKELINIPRVVQFFQAEVNKLNRNLGQFEQIKRFKIVCDEWSTHTGELSPTLKLKRRVITAKYHNLIENIYFSNKMNFRD